MSLSLQSVSKQYKQTVAVDAISFDFQKGVYGLLGQNGAGKTTLMKMLCTIYKPTSGVIMYQGKPVLTMGEDYRDILGYLPQEFGYYPEFTAYKFLIYISGLKGIPKDVAHKRTLELLEVVNLLDMRNHKIKTFSGGMKRRLGIAQALLNEPDVLILDEPTSGLDPSERVYFKNLISTISQNKIVILSTHIVSDVEYIANTILMMQKGKILLKGKPDELIKSIEEMVWECKIDVNSIESYKQKHVVSGQKIIDNQVVLRIVSKQKPMQTATSVPANLEDLYLYLYKGGIED